MGRITAGVRAAPSTSVHRARARGDDLWADHILVEDGEGEHHAFCSRLGAGEGHSRKDAVDHGENPVNGLKPDLGPVGIDEGPGARPDRQRPISAEQPTVAG